MPPADSAPRRWKPLSRASLAVAAVPCLLYLVESFIVTVLEVRLVQHGFSLGATLLAFAPHLRFVLVVFLLFALLHGSRRRLISLTGTVAFHLLMAFSLTAVAFSHGYFLATGTHLSFSVVGYWAHNLAATSRIISSEATAPRLTFLFAQPLVVIGNVAVFTLKRVRRGLAAGPELPRRRSLQVAAGAATLAVVLLFAPRPHGRAMAVARCVPLDIIDGAVRSLLPERISEVEGRERLDAALQLTRTPGAPRPNIVFIIFESLGWKSSDLYVPGRRTTPFLAELKPRSLVVEREYTVVPHTTKAIVPLLCGFYPYLSTPPKETVPGILPRRCLAHILADQGYRTAFFQPAENFEGRAQLVANMGYETFRGEADLPKEGFEEPSYFGYEDKIVLRPSMEWVDQVRKEPFFLTYLTLATHHNYVTPQSFPELPYPDAVSEHQRNYFNAVRYIDSFIKDVFTEFEKRGLLDNTVFFIVGDHGEAFGEHGRGQHDLILWEEGIHAGAMLYGPKFLPTPGVIEGYRSHLDMVPTVCDLLGLKLEQGEFLGQSLLKPLAPGRKQFYSCWFDHQCLAMRDDGVKLIYHYDQQPPEVYDNTEDAFDRHNLAYQGPYDERFIRQRTEEMLRWRRVVNQQYEEWEAALKEGQVTRRAPRVARALRARFGDAIELVGYEAIPPRATPGQTVRLRYVFRSLERVPDTTRLFVHLEHAGAFVNLDHVPVRGTYPVARWRPGEYIVDEQQVHIPASWRDGEATVHLGFWDRRTGQRLPVRETTAPVVENRLVVARIPIEARSVTRPVAVDLEARRAKIGSWITRERPAIGRPAGTVFGGRIELTAVELKPNPAELAGTYNLTLVFHAREPIPENWRLRVSLVHANGRALDASHVPIGGLYPTKYWQAGEYVIDRYKYHIDYYRSQVGQYTVWLGFEQHGRPVPAAGPGELDLAQRVKLGTVRIVEPKIRMVK